MESKHHKNVDNPFSEFVNTGDHLRKSEVEERVKLRRILGRSWKVSRYFQKVEQECRVEHLRRVLSPCFQNKRKDSDDVSRDFLG